MLERACHTSHAANFHSPMNEQAARLVVLAGAVESADGKFEIFSLEDRRFASSNAKELAQWSASQHGAPVTPDNFLQQRAEQLVKRLSERFPKLHLFLYPPTSFALLWIGLPVAALLAGMFLDQVTNPHRVDLLSAPLLLIVVWNLAVYGGLLIWPWLPAGKLGHHPAGLGRVVDLISFKTTRLPRKLPSVLVSALMAFIMQWMQLSRRLALARVGRMLHLASALFALGAIASLYTRGFLAKYSAGWESTFLDAGQVHAALSVLFTPAMTVFQIQGFSVADVEALRFGQPPLVESGARWVHLYAATLLLLVILPRLLLAGIAGLQAKKWVENFPLDLNQPYYRRLLAALGSAPGTLRVLPYSFAVDEARAKGLIQVASQLLGDQARVLMRPSLDYGSEPGDALRGIDLTDTGVALTAVLFSLSATPEHENHGALLDILVGVSTRGIAVLVDESGYLERLGGQAGAAARMDERHALWQQFCSVHKAPATFVNLLDPDAKPLDMGAGISPSRVAA